MTVTVRRSQQLDTRSSDKLWLRQRDRLKSTLLRQSERPERLCWTWVIRRWLTEYRGWTSRLFRTRWFSTARIAQGLKDDEEVEKTTLSETLSTQSPLHSNSSRWSSFPQGNLPSQDSSWCPLRAQASWWPRSQWQQGPSSYQMSHWTCLDTEELARRSAIYASLADYGGIGDRRALAQGRTL